MTALLRAGLHRRAARGAAVLAAALMAGASACEADGSALPQQRPATAAAVAPEPLDTIPGTVWTHEDWRIFQEKVRWAVSEGLDSLPAGQAVARLGVTFVGTTYTPGTLEAPGPEGLVVNLRELDCVTFIETVLALSRFVRNHGVEALDDPEGARAAYEGYLTALRYRGGRLDGYASRLHYFSEWLADNEARGLLTVITSQLGGVPDAEPVDFMSTHPAAYRQLADPQVLARIREVEARLSASGPRVYVPQEAIARVADEIRDGDLIAATSTVAGLDVAHTGIALRVDGRLHLLHAPLVGKSVEISTLPLAQRIVGISGQDGIMVARILEEGF